METKIVTFRDEVFAEINLALTLHIFLGDDGDVKQPITVEMIEEAIQNTSTSELGESVLDCMSEIKIIK
jgi:hypothetical protein